jgi:hypothetical protein
MFTLQFSTTTEPFDSYADEIARTVADVAKRIARVGIDFDDARPVFDANGNTIGSFKVTRS